MMNNMNRFSFFSVCFLLISITGFGSNGLVFQTGHNNPVQSIDFSSGSKFLATSDVEREVVIWDIASGRQYLSFSHTNKITKIAFHPKNEFELFYLDESGSVFQVDFSVSDLKATSIPGSGIKDFQFINDSILLSAGLGIHRYNLNTGKTEKFISDINLTEISAGMNGILGITETGEFYYYDYSSLSFNLFGKTRVRDLVFSADRNCWYGISPGAEIHQLSFDDKGKFKNQVFKEKGKHLGIKSIDLSSSFLYAACNGQLIYEYNFHTYKYRVVSAHNQSITKIKTNRSGNLLASAAEDNSIIIWDLKRFLPQIILKGAYVSIATLKFSSDDNALILGTTTGSFKYWRFSDNKFYSAKIPIDENRKRKGWRSVVENIDSVQNEFIYFRSLEIQLHGGSNKIKQLLRFEGYWNTLSNSISLKETSRQRFSKSDTITESALIKSIRTNSAKTHGVFDQFSAIHKNKLFTGDYNSKFKFFAISDDRGQITFYNSNREFLLNVSLIGIQDFLFSDSLGNYFGTKRAIENVSYRSKNHLYSIGQLDLFLNRPDIILPKLPYYDQSEISKLRQAILIRRRRSGFSEDLNINAYINKIPELSVSPKFDFNNSNYAVSVNPNENQHLIQFIEIRDNGVLVNRVDVNGKIGVIDIDFEVFEGNNQVDVIGVGQDFYTLPIKFKFTSSLKRESKPKLFFVGIGISEYLQSQYNLQYAVKDVKDVYQVLQKSHMFSSTDSCFILNGNADSASVYKKLNQFISLVKPTDILIVYYAGHGVLSSDFDYYLGSHDIDFSLPNKRGILFDDFFRVIDNSNAFRRLLILDACHSGEFDKSEVEIQQSTVKSADDGELAFRSVGNVTITNKSTTSAFELSRQIFSDFKMNNGTIVVSASGGMEYAMESAKLKNGLFSYVLISGIQSGEADLNKDGRISLQEL